MLISSLEQSPLGQYAEMMSMAQRSGVLMETPIASIVLVLMMLSLCMGWIVALVRLHVCLPDFTDDIVGSKFDSLVVVSEVFTN